MVDSTRMEYLPAIHLKVSKVMGFIYKGAVVNRDVAPSYYSPTSVCNQSFKVLRPVAFLRVGCRFPICVKVCVSRSMTFGQCKDKQITTSPDGNPLATRDFLNTSRTKLR